MYKGLQRSHAQRLRRLRERGQARQAKTIQRFYRMHLYGQRYKTPQARMSNRISNLSKRLYLNADDRWKDTWWQAQSVPSLATILDIADLGSIAQGDNIDQRAGNKIAIKSLYLSFNILASDAYNNMRFIIFTIPCNNSGTLPTLDQILAGVNTVPIALPSVHSPYKKNSTLEFKIHKDMSFTLQRQQAGAVRPQNKVLTFTMKFNGIGHTVHYETGTATPPIKGNLYLLAISDSQAGPHPTFTCYSRLNYSG